MVYFIKCYIYISHESSLYIPIIHGTCSHRLVPMVPMNPNLRPGSVWGSHRLCTPGSVCSLRQEPCKYGGIYSGIIRDNTTQMVISCFVFILLDHGGVAL